MKSGCLDDDLLQMFLDGILVPAERALVTEHLKRCRSCQAAISDYKQLMWDLDHPDPAPVPAEMDPLYESLMDEWKHATRPEPVKGKQRQRGRQLLPSWVGYSLMWTRSLPGFDKINRLRLRPAPKQTASGSGSILRRLLKRGGGR